jgi:hypothetical protein
MAQVLAHALDVSPLFVVLYVLWKSPDWVCKCADARDRWKRPDP